MLSLNKNKISFIITNFFKLNKLLQLNNFSNFRFSINNSIESNDIDVNNNINKIKQSKISDTLKVIKKTNIKKKKKNTEKIDNNMEDISNINFDSNLKQIPEGEKLKIFNWNVNGIRASISKGALDKLIKEGKII
jgi:hypothetical protein